MKKVFFLLFFCLILSGCYVQSLSRFYTDDLKIAFPQIEGEWISLVQIGEDVSRKQISPWKFTENSIETYDEENRFAQLETAYFRIGDNIFMDFTAGSPLKGAEEVGNLFWGAGIALTHSLCKVRIEGNNLVITPLNLEWFEDRIEEKRLDLSFVKSDRGSNYIFTASTAQWITFLKTCGDDEEVFDEKHRFVFRRQVGQ